MRKTKTLVKVTMTDLFCGEPNYSSVKHWHFVVNEKTKNGALVRIAKALTGFTGIREETCEHGDGTLEIRPRHCGVVIFVEFPDSITGGIELTNVDSILSSFANNKLAEVA